MERMLIWVQRICKSAMLSILIMLALGQVQLYFQIKDSQQYINLGFPFPYFWFSHDDDQLSGGRMNHLIIDFILTFIVVFVCSLLFHQLKSRFYKSKTLTF